MLFIARLMAAKRLLWWARTRMSHLVGGQCPGCPRRQWMGQCRLGDGLSARKTSRYSQHRLCLQQQQWCRPHQEIQWQWHWSTPTSALGRVNNYPAYGIAQAGSSGRLIGQSVDRQWWAVRLNPEIVGAGNGWVLAATVEVTGAENVPTIDTPPASDVGSPTATSCGCAGSHCSRLCQCAQRSKYAFPVLVVAPPGASGEVVGKSSDNQWWQVKISDPILSRWSRMGFSFIRYHGEYLQRARSCCAAHSCGPADNASAKQFLCFAFAESRRLYSDVSGYILYHELDSQEYRYCRLDYG